MAPTLQLSETCIRAALYILLCSGLCACTSVPLPEGTSLGSHAEMTVSGGTLTKAKLRIDAAPILAARTVRIVPTSVRIGRADTFDRKDLALVTNAVDRALCTGLSDRFQVVAASVPADLVVHATITDIVATNRTAAATSTIASLGGSAFGVPVPRLPIGLGGLAIQAEAVGEDGQQKAAMLWSRGANMITTKAKMSVVGDAYSLSSAFAADFSRMMVKGRDPFKGMSGVPSTQRIWASLGGNPKYGACKTFGRAAGIKGVVAGQFGLPPNWIDKGAAASQ